MSDSVNGLNQIPDAIPPNQAAIRRAEMHLESINSAEKDDTSEQTRFHYHRRTPFPEDSSYDTTFSTPLVIDRKQLEFLRAEALKSTSGGACAEAEKGFFEISDA